jgi:hypothetical protein
MPLAQPRFPLGQVVATRAAHALMAEHHISPTCLLRRHQRGDWGQVDAEDARTNEAALVHGQRLLSVYHCDGVVLWVITEADRSATTILLPEDY